MIILMDPPEQTRIRGILLRAFTPRRGQRDDGELLSRDAR